MQSRVFLPPAVIAGIAALTLAGRGATEPAPTGATLTLSEQFEECATCHEEHTDEFLLNPHSALETEGTGSGCGQAAASSCAACHGDPTAPPRRRAAD